MHRAELLIPVGSLEKLRAALLYGADAVYMGTPDLSLRARTAMSLEDVVEGIRLAHGKNKRAYLTLNLFSHNKDIEKLDSYIDVLKTVEPDGVIVADPGVFMRLRQTAPALRLHISTQANICSWQAVEFWENMGASLCVLAREVSFAELKEIRHRCPNMKLETFVHGAMCMTYSGRCLLSNFMAQRGANQGSCANSCRWKYKVHLKLKDGRREELILTEDNRELFEFLLEEEFRPGDFLPLEETEEGSYILNSKDLCLMPKLDELLAAGVDSLKVEGRHKSPFYVAQVASAYRRAIDAWYNDPQSWDFRPYMRELSAVPNRGYTLGFHEGTLKNFAHNYEHTATFSDWLYAGMVEKTDSEGFLFRAKTKLICGTVLTFMLPSGETIRLRLYDFIDGVSRIRKSVVQPSVQPLIFLPFALFDREDSRRIRRVFEVGLVARTERVLTSVESARRRLDKEALALESQTAAASKRYSLYRKDLQAALKEAPHQTAKAPKNESCCGRGCNGCLPFWYDEAYGRARALLAQKKKGEYLSVQERDSLLASLSSRPQE